jgi:hypothetical protein
MGLAALAFFVLLSLADFFDDDTESIYGSEEQRNQTSHQYIVTLALHTSRTLRTASLVFTL